VQQVLKKDWGYNGFVMSNPSTAMLPAP